MTGTSNAAAAAAASNEVEEKQAQSAPSQPAADKEIPAEAEIKHSDMPREMLADVVRVAIEAVISCKDEKAAAVKLKKHLDDKYAKSTWHCVLGKHFAISFSHATKFCAFFTVREFNVLVFKGDD